MCVVREKYLYPHHSGENCTFQYFRSRQGPLPIALPSEVSAMPPWSSHSLPFSVDVPQARTSPGRQGHVAIILLRRTAPWSSFELITPGSQQKRWVKSGFGVGGCRDTSGAVSGQGRQRVVGNEVSHSWYVSRTAVGPAVGSLKVV